jgi:hypothetical protein
MQKTTIILILATIFLGLCPFTVSAATVSVENYFYAHANTAGTFPFKDKFNSINQYGDTVQHDASIVYVIVDAQGMAAGDEIQVISDTGTTYTATPGTQLQVSANDYIKINLIKTGTNEVLAKLTEMKTFDQSDGGTDVYYYFTNYGTPSNYGDLGPGSGGGTPATVTGNHYYFPPRDAYKYDYTPPAGATRYELHFTAPNGTPYMRAYEQAPTGVHYLTCNGSYEMQFFNGTGSMIAKSPAMTTTEIVSPTCDSVPGTGTGFTDITVRTTPTGIEWDPVPGATDYDVYKDGTQIGTTTGTSMDVPTGGGPVTVVAKDSTGAVIGQTDVTPAPNTDPPPSTGCDGCEFLKDMLACPEWDTYMGDLTGAISDALPPPPDWDLVADKIGNAVIGKLSDYIGTVPTAPTVPEIDSGTHVDLPPINNQVPDAQNLNPEVPADFNTPKPFDLSDAPVIQVPDESRPFIISDPMSNVPHDDPGVPVLPGDSSNDNGGIVDPISTLPASTPKPSGPPPTDTTPAPSQEIPTPSGSPSGPAIPGATTGEIPIPTTNIEGGS